MKLQHSILLHLFFTLSLVNVTFLVTSPVKHHMSTSSQHQLGNGQVFPLLLALNSPWQPCHRGYSQLPQTRRHRGDGGEAGPGQHLSQRPSVPKPARARSHSSSHGGVSDSQRQSARTDRWRRRGEDRWEGGGCREMKETEGPLVYREKSLKYFLFVSLLAFCCDLLTPVFIIHLICVERG